MMNHITRLQRENGQLRLALDAARKGLREIRAYVQSSKYHEWPYVNVQDIVGRCDHWQTEIDFHESLCPVCRLAPAGADLICTDCAAAIEYGKAEREHRAREAATS